MTRDAGSKQDAPPSDRQPDAAVQEHQDEAREAVGQQQAEGEASADPGRSGAAVEDAPKPKRKRAPKKADGTAAAETGVDKDAAEAGATGAEATEDKPKTSRRARAKQAAAEAEEAAKPAAQPSRSRRRGAEQRVTVRAQAKFVRTSARKARLVADHVRGKDVQQARAILAFSPRSVAQDWSKVLESAIANAEHNHDLVGDDLKVLNATADEGPTLKRFRPRAMGRATRIRKRTSHLTITLTPKD
jgi:ribosomal protein L22